MNFSERMERASEAIALKTRRVGNVPSNLGTLPSGEKVCLGTRDSRREGEDFLRYMLVPLLVLVEYHCLKLSLDVGIYLSVGNAVCVV